jgi:hypothetical protein
MTLTDRASGSPWAYLALAVIILACALPGVVKMPPLDRDESRFAQASAQMLETGDYVVIRYHDGLRNKKPAGIHWLQAAATALTSSGEAREMWSYRLPSLAGAILAAFATLWGGSTLVGRQPAFIAAVALGGSLLLSSEAHIGKTDAALCGVMALLLASLARLRGGHPRGMALLFWISLAAGVLLKGVISPMVAALCVVSLWLWERDLSWAKPLWRWSGPALFVAIAAPWYVLVQIQTQGAFLYEAAAVDLGQKIVSAAEGHTAPPGAHLAGLPLLFWPGILVILPGVIAAAGALRSSASWPDPALRSSLRLLFCYCAPAWLVFELTPTKLVHYPLPLYPAIALAGAAGCLHLFKAGNGRRLRIAGGAVFALAGLALAAVTAPPVLDLLRAEPAEAFGPGLQDKVAAIWRQDADQSGSGWMPAIAIAVATLVAVTAFALRRIDALLAGLIACSLAAGVSLRSSVLPAQSWMLASRAALDAMAEVCALPAGTAARERTGCPEGGPSVISAIAYAEPSLVFELAGRIVLPPDSSANVPPPSEEATPAWLINTFEDQGRIALAGLMQSAAASNRCLRTAERYAYNYSNGEPSILTAAILEAGPCR